MAQLIEERARLAPDAVALVASDGMRTLTYGALNRGANRLAHHLRSLGISRDAIVGVCLERSFDVVVALLAVLKADGAYLPLDPDYPAARIAFMLEDSNTQALISRQALSDSLPPHAAQLITLDGDAALLQQPDVDSTPVATSDDLAYVIYTSGSTGRPKGVRVTHGNLLNLVSWHCAAFDVTVAARATQLASLSFDAAGWELWPYLTTGALVHLVDDEVRATPKRLRDWLIANAITHSFVPTPMAEDLLMLDWAPEIALRYLLTGGDVLHRRPPSGLPFTLINNYGPTETTVVATSGAVSPAAPGQSDTDRPDLPAIGWPITNTQVYILDERLGSVPAGMLGELYIGGRGVARGYLNRPTLTAERFIPDPFSTESGALMYKTGDLGRYLSDGQIAFLGRVDDLVKVRGYRIELDEITCALNQHPHVQVSAVLAREDTPGEKSLVAYIVASPGASLSISDLRAFLGARLPDYMVPAAFVSLAALPLTSNGKVDRVALPVPCDDNSLRDAPVESPGTAIEARIAAIIAALLRRDQVGRDDNFFFLGGHSLLGAQLIAQVADTFGVELSLRTLFEAPTVRELSTEIEDLIVAKVDAMSDDEIQQFMTNMRIEPPPAVSSDVDTYNHAEPYQ